MSQCTDVDKALAALEKKIDDQNREIARLNKLQQQCCNSKSGNNSNNNNLEKRVKRLEELVKAIEEFVLAMAPLLKVLKNFPLFRILL